MTLTTEELVTKEVQNQVEILLKDMGITNYTTEISAGTIRGDNYLGIIAKVDVKGRNKNNQDVVLHFIVKSAPRNEFFRQAAPIREVYEREIYMYTKVFPEMIKFQEERGVLKPFNSLTKCYKGTMNDLNEALIMENMKEIGYQLRDRKEPLNYNHVLMVMREYGKYHALSYALRDQKPEIFEEFAKNGEDVFFKCFWSSENMQKSIDIHNERALKALDHVKCKDARDKYSKYLTKQQNAIGFALKSESAGKHGVIGHGDSWVNNMLFKYKDPSNPDCPENVCILDWQLARLGSPALDLSYFIFACTDKKLREAHYHDLIKEYHNSLSSFLKDLGSDPEKLFPFHVLQEHLKKFSVYGLFMSIMALYMMHSEVEEIPDIHTLKDGEEAMEKFSYESKNIEKYNIRVRDVISDYIAYGYEL